MCADKLDIFIHPLYIICLIGVRMRLRALEGDAIIGAAWKGYETNELISE